MQSGRDREGARRRRLGESCERWNGKRLSGFSTRSPYTGIPAWAMSKMQPGQMARLHSTARRRLRVTRCGQWLLRNSGTTDSPRAANP
jgi:hypothetical protein